MPDATNDLVVQVIRGEISGVRDEIAGIRDDVSRIAAQVQGMAAEQGPKLAVLEHRVAEAEADIKNIHADRVRENTQMWGLKVAAFGAVLAALLSMGTQFFTGA